MPAELVVIVPSRGRPEAVPRVVDAWHATDAYQDAALLFAVDEDDPAADQYRAQASPEALMVFCAEWLPMVAKLNAVAAYQASADRPFALGFAGDDHLPRTPGWAATMLAALRDMDTGVVYGDDLLQGERLCTSWAMTSDIVRTLGRMVPAPVEHMYCDNSVMDVAKLAGCLRYLPAVVIEHVHPLAGKAEWDEGYRHVNRREQYRADELAYRRWIRDGRAADVAAVRVLRSSRG